MFLGGATLFKILDKLQLSEGIKKYVIDAPLIARKCQPGQFIILRLNENGERIPLTIADFDRNSGSITLIVQEVGNTTREMATFNVGDYILDVAGPLGQPTHIEKLGTVVCIGGGIGVAPVYPIARAFKEKKNKVISIIGARNSDLIIFEDEMKNVSDEMYITTDDGSKGQKGFVTDKLKELIVNGENINMVMAIGPVVMMKAVAETTRPYQIKTIVSLNPIMVDGTGMCGGCRVKVGQENKFACVDGPDFDAHLVDFNNLMIRQRMYTDYEKHEHSYGGNCKCHNH